MKQFTFKPPMPMEDILDKIGRKELMERLSIPDGTFNRWISPEYFPSKKLKIIAKTINDMLCENKVNNYEVTEYMGETIRRNNVWRIEVGNLQQVISSLGGIEYICQSPHINISKAGINRWQRTGIPHTQIIQFKFLIQEIYDESHFMYYKRNGLSFTEPEFDIFISKLSDKNH